MLADSVCSMHIELLHKQYHNMHVGSQPLQNLHVCSQGTCQQWGADDVPRCLSRNDPQGSKSTLIMAPISRWCRKGYHELNSGTLQMLMRPAAASGVLFDYACIPDIGTLVSASDCSN